jgi:hypothetical protein
MFATFNKDQMLRDFANARMIYLIRVRQSACEGAQKHLHRGFLVRVSMMEESIVELHEQLRKANGPLSSYLASKLTLLINAYYLNLAGSLDNLAWAIIYQHALCKPVNEDCHKQRKLAHLLGKEFLDALPGKGLEELSQKLRAKRAWYREMKEFRDPAAHRIPILVPMALYSEADIDEQRRLDSEAAGLCAQGKHSEGMTTWRKINRLGKQLPIFTSETSSLRMYDLAGRLNLDHENWNTLASASLSIGFT